MWKGIASVIQRIRANRRIPIAVCPEAVKVTFPTVRIESGIGKYATKKATPKATENITSFVVDDVP